MPRLPVDGKKVIEHRVTLGSYEREQLDTLVTGVTVRNVGDPLVALLSDVSALAVLAGILEALGVIDLTGLAKKLGGQGAAWIEAVLSGAFASLDEAMNDWYEKVADLIPDIIPGGEEWTPFSGGGGRPPRVPTSPKRSSVGDGSDILATTNRCLSISGTRLSRI